MKCIQPKVFLSYSRKDAGFVLKLRSDLIAAGIDCWMDTDMLSAGDRFRKEIFEEGIAHCDLFIAYVTEEYLHSEWCDMELCAVLDRPHVTVMPLASSDEVLKKLPTVVRNDVQGGVINEENYWSAVLGICRKALIAVQNSRRLVPSHNHLLAVAGKFDLEEFQRENLLKRVRKELILAAQNLRGWLTNDASRESLLNLVRSTNVTVTLIMATYETLRPLSEEGAGHLWQSVEQVERMRNALTEEQRLRFRAYFHNGAATLSAVFVDPESRDGLLFFNPRWSIQHSPDDRLTCVIDKSINDSSLFRAIYGSVLNMTQNDAKTVAEMLGTPAGGVRAASKATLQSAQRRKTKQRV